MAAATFLPTSRSGLAMACEEAAQEGSVQMIRVVIDTVLFSCMGAFGTAIVIAVATLAKLV